MSKSCARLWQLFVVMVEYIFVCNILCYLSWLCGFDAAGSAVSGKSLTGPKSPAMIPSGLRAWILSFEYYCEFGLFGKEVAGEK